MPRQFQGKIELDVHNSQADRPAFPADKAPEGRGAGVGQKGWTR
jgi:hypothetical protein